MSFTKLENKFVGVPRYIKDILKAAAQISVNDTQLKLKSSHLARHTLLGYCRNRHIYLIHYCFQNQNIQYHQDIWTCRFRGHSNAH